MSVPDLLGLGMGWAVWLGLLEESALGWMLECAASPPTRPLPFFPQQACWCLQTGMMRRRM